MPYATQTDITTLYGPDAIYVADRDNDGVADVAVVAAALIAATAEIDSYLAVRYDLPVAGTHEILTQLCVDIALYRMAGSADVMTEAHQDRYKSAVTHLMRFSKGDARLIIPADPGTLDPDGARMAGGGPNAIVAGGPAREFTRTRMRGL